MKKDKLSTLLRLAETRKRVCEARHAAARNEIEALVGEAARLRKLSCTPLDAGEAEDASNLAVYGRYLAGLRRASAAKLEAAKAREPECAVHEQSLRAALREEIAWSALHDRALSADRKQRLDREEAAREALQLIRARRLPGRTPS